MRAKTSVQQNFEVYSLEIKLRMDFGILRPNCKLQKPPVAYLRGDNLGVSQRIPSAIMELRSSPSSSSLIVLIPSVIS